MNEDCIKRLSSGDDERTQGNPLDRVVPRKATSSARAKISFTIFAVRPADWDNWHIKELQDVLVHAGILDGDEWNMLRGEIISEKVHTKAEERTEISIEKIKP